MGRTWSDDIPPPPGPSGEHPVVALIALAAMALAMVLILWAGFEIHGTEGLESALAEPAEGAPGPEAARPVDDRDVDAAVASSRWATGFSP